MLSERNKKNAQVHDKNGMELNLLMESFASIILDLCTMFVYQGGNEDFIAEQNENINKQ